MIKINSQTSLGQLLEAYNTEKDLVVTELYKIFRADFLTFINRYSGDKELNVDCYQESIMALYENLKNKKILDSKSSVKTYLFAIGKNQILNAIKKKIKTVESQDFDLDNIQIHNDVDEEQKDFLSRGFDQLGDKCKEILINFYYKQYSIDAIMHSMDYKNENTVKAHKSRCLSQLRSILENMNLNNGI